MVSKMDVVVLNLCFVTLNSPDEMRCLVYFRALRFVDSREPTLELARDQAPGFLESFLFGQKLDAWYGSGCPDLWTSFCLTRGKTWRKQKRWAYGFPNSALYLEIRLNKLGASRKSGALISCWSRKSTQKYKIKKGWNLKLIKPKHSPK